MELLILNRRLATLYVEQGRYVVAEPLRVETLEWPLPNRFRIRSVGASTL